MLVFDVHWAKPIIKYLSKINLQELDKGMQCAIEGRVLTYWAEDVSCINVEILDEAGRGRILQVIIIGLAETDLKVEGAFSRAQSRVFAAAALVLLSYHACQIGSGFERELSRWTNIAWNPKKHKEAKKLFEGVACLFEEAEEIEVEEDGEEDDDEEERDWDEDEYDDEDFEEDDDDDDLPSSEIIARKLRLLPRADDPKPNKQNKNRFHKIEEAAAAESPEWWREFIHEEDPERRRQILTQAIMRRLNLKQMDKWLVGDALYRLNPQRPALDVLERFDSVLDTMGRTMPSFRGKANAADPRLAAFLDSPEMLPVRQRIEDDRTASHLIAWLESHQTNAMAAKAGPLSIELVWRLVPRSPGFCELRWQLLATTPKMHREPRNFQAIASLAAELESGNRVAPAEQAQLLFWISNSSQTRDFRYETFPGSESFGPSFPVLNAALWLSLWGKDHLIRWLNGEEVIFNSSAARLLVEAPSGQPPQWIVEIPLPDSRARRVALTDCALVFESRSEGTGAHSRQHVYLLESGTLRPLSCGGMPNDLLERLHDRPVFPVEKLRNSRAGAVLVSRYAPPSPTPAPPAGKPDAEASQEEDTHSAASADGAAPLSDGLMELVRLHPVVECRYEDGTAYFTAVARQRGDADGEIKFVRVAQGIWQMRAQRSRPLSPYAPRPREFSEPLQEVRSLIPEADGAQATATGEAQAATVNEPELDAPNPWAICIAPHPKDVAGVDAFFDRLLSPGTKFDIIDGGAAQFRMKVNRENLARLHDAWVHRPRGVRFLGDKAFAELVQLRRPPKFNLRIESSGIDWLSVSVEMERDIETLKPSEVSAALNQESSDLIVLTGGRVYRRDDLEQYRKWMDALSDWGLDTGQGEQRLHVMQLAGSDHSRELLDLTDASGHDSLRALAETARGLLKSFKGVPSANVAATTAHWLRPYQRQGADFLVWALRVFGGAILADDMGLGKTLQMLAALTALRSASGSGGSGKDGDGDEHGEGNGSGDARLPSLVICPASVAHNWLREAARFAPELRTAVLASGGARRDVIQRANEYDLIITNYALARRDSEQIQARRWLLACVDEAQMIKNPATGIARAVKAIQARFRLALTGTPIENRLTDLWSIADFVAPGYLASRRKFESRMKEEDAERSFRSLRSKLRPLLMRRLKSEVAPELPPRIEERRDCEMTPGQRHTYLAAVKHARQMLEGVEDEKLRGPARIQMLAALTRLRQICCDPALAGFKDKGSGKLDATLDMVEELIEAGHKTLLFSQFVKMLDILVPLLKKRGIPLWMLTGQTSAAKRHGIIADFEASKKPGVFLISLKAGGLGLNLVSASHVILFDPWWNPAVEAQAIDRTHRIGQDKTVVAFRMVTEGTVEERVLELQEKKRGLIKNVLEEEAFNRVLSREDFKFLLEE
ncbi:MAG: DEAD/DEAH box helicase [Candidatus Sumerlaeota bacterium]|nr:DEAD/DEAH box helicase [Candidatus Sumerlaeota bacterium]